jgi:hypothetical protein
VLNALKRNVKASALKRQNARKTARIRRIARKNAKSNATAKRKTARSNVMEKRRIAARNNFCWQTWWYIGLGVFIVKPFSLKS